MSYTAIISKSLKARGIETPSENLSPYWTASFHGLNKIGVYQDLREEAKNSLLIDLSQAQLEEAIHVERRGIDFASKMILMARSDEEKQIYSLIHADELEHFFEIKRFLHRNEASEDENPFIVLLKEIVDTSDSYLMVFFLQIILEGWGMTHYNDLSSNCSDPKMQVLLKRILHDEARHHGTGLVHYKLRADEKRDVDAMTEIMAKFLYMIQIGPQTAIGHLNRYHQGLTKSQIEEAFNECSSVINAQKTLNGVKRLLSHDLDQSLIERLDKRGMFRAFTAQESTEVCLSLA